MEEDVDLTITYEQLSNESWYARISEANSGSSSDRSAATLGELINACLEWAWIDSSLLELHKGDTEEEVLKSVKEFNTVIKANSDNDIKISLLRKHI